MLDFLLGSSPEKYDEGDPARFQAVYDTNEGSGKIRTFRKAGTTFSCFSNKSLGNPSVYYLLALRWVGYQSDDMPKFADVVQDHKLVRTRTSNPTTHPVLPDGVFLNDFSGWMFRSSSTGWQSLYGDRLFAGLFRRGVLSVTRSTGIPILTANNTPAVLYGPNAGWNSDDTLSQTGFGLWTHPNNQGPCGGANKPGTDKICPIITSNTAMGNHGDLTNTKSLYLKAPGIEVIAD